VWIEASYNPILDPNGKPFKVVKFATNITAQIETLDSLNIKLQDTVTIKPGILGAFFLSTPRSQTIRVHRIL
jgi:hypothetical protein